MRACQLWYNSSLSARISSRKALTVDNTSCNAEAMACWVSCSMGIASLVSWVERISLRAEVRGQAIERCQTTNQFLHACTVAPFVIIPGDDFDEGLLYDLGERWVKDARMAIAHNV